MNYMCGRSSSERNNSSNKKSKETDKNCCCVTTLTGDSTYFNHNKDKQHKIRRLKTRKERCQIRAGRTDTFKHKSHHHHCFCQSKKGLSFFPNSFHCCNWPTRKNTQISSVVPVTQEPSIITESRLIGHHGLFSHEVKSIDIERLLSEQSKIEGSEQKTKDENINTSNLSSTPCNPVFLSSEDLLVANDDVPVNENADTSRKIHGESQEVKMMNLSFSNQGADITPGQRLQQQLYSSCESLKSDNQSKHIFQPAKTKITDNCTSGIDEDLQLNFFAERDQMKTFNRTTDGDMISDLNQPYNNQDYQAKGDSLISSALQQVTSCSGDNLQQKQKHHDPDHVSNTTCVVAARLCDSLHLPIPNWRNLLSESREVLLKSLQNRHGACLQTILQEVQQSLRCVIEPTQATMEPEPRLMGEDELLSTDAFVKTTGSDCFCWDSSPRSRHNLQQITDESANSVDTFANILDETFRPGFSPHPCMDFELPGTSASDFFAHSILPQEENVSRPQLWEDNRSNTHGSALTGSIQNHLMKPTRKFREWINEEQPCHSDILPFFSHQDRHSANLQDFPQNLTLSETDRFYFAPFLPSNSRSQPQSNHLKTFGHLSPFQANFRSNPIDMKHYPPSHMLERSLALPSSSLESPEHWSFPPMRLY